MHLEAQTNRRNKEKSLAFPTKVFNHSYMFFVLGLCALFLTQALMASAQAGLSSGTPVQSSLGAPIFELKVDESATSVIDQSSIDVLSSASLPVLHGFSYLTYGGAYFSKQPYVSGGTAPYTWSAQGLPNWLSIDPGTGKLSGWSTTNDVGSVQFDVTVTDNAGLSDTAAFAITVQLFSTSGLTLYPDFLAATEGETFRYYFQTTSQSWGKLLWSSQNLPAWLSLNQKGQIIGIPKASDVGKHTFDVSVSDGLSFSQATFTIVVEPEQSNSLSLIGRSLQAVEGNSFSYFVSATGGDNASYAWSSSNLPSWLTLDIGTGEISGTPGAADIGSKLFDIEVDDGVHQIQATFQISVLTQGQDAEDFKITNVWSLPDAQAGQGYNQEFKSEGALRLPTWSAQNLPVWLNLNPTTGVLSGTPALSDQGLTTFEVSAHDGTHSTSQTFKLVVIQNLSGALHIATSELAVARAGQVYSYSLEASGGSSSYQWSATGLPQGLSIDANTGTIAGTPEADSAGTYDVTLILSDALTTDTQRSYLFTVTPSAAPAHLSTASSVPGDKSDESGGSCILSSRADHKQNVFLFTVCLMLSLYGLKRFFMFRSR